MSTPPRCPTCSKPMTLMGKHSETLRTVGGVGGVAAGAVGALAVTIGLVAAPLLIAIPAAIAVAGGSVFGSAVAGRKLGAAIDPNAKYICIPCEELRSGCYSGYSSSDDDSGGDYAAFD